jgi:hypothetical protein
MDAETIKEAIAHENLQILQNITDPIYLHMAAKFGSLKMVKFLSQKLSFAQDKDGNTPLHIAVSGKRAVVVDYFLNSGFDCTIKNNEGKDCFEIASSDIAVVIERHRKLYVATKLLTLEDIKNPVDLLEFYDNRAKQLIDINHQNVSGQTILHKAAAADNVELVTLCLKLKADPLVRDSKTRLPLDVAGPKVVPLLKSVLTQASFVSVPKTSNILSGVLLKWTNYAGGYKKRWFVLENGVLSYYKSMTELDSCRGSISLKNAKLQLDSSDKNRFEVIGSNIRFHLRAEHLMEAKRWIIALTEAKQWIQDNSEFSKHVEQSKAHGNLSKSSKTSDSITDSLEKLHLGNFSNLSHRGSLEWDKNSYLSDSDISAGDDDDDYLEKLNLKIDDAISSLRYLEEKYQTNFKNLMSFLNKISHMSNNREAYWKKKYSKSNALLKVWEDNLRSLAADHDALQETASKNINELKQNQEESSSQVPSEESREEFFDAEDHPEIDSSNFLKTSSLGYFMDMNMARTVLPTNKNAQEISLWSILRNNIGKDLSKIPLPVFFNEPLSMLQRLCEDMEYSSLLDVAASKDDPLERIQYVAAFAISNYSSTMKRSGKPFNPLLGETFEYVRCDRGFRYISEQVSHHPVILFNLI